MTVLSESVEAARRRALAAVAASDAADAIVARREAGTASPDDDALTEARTADLLRDQGDDGSWDGDLVRSAEALLTLHDLLYAGPDLDADRGPTDPSHPLARVLATTSPAVDRGLAWLRDSRGRPGRFGEGCSPERHGDALCHHFMTGFFSPGPPEARLAGLRLAIGAEVAGEEEARLAASCTALRCVLRWGGHETTDARLHLDALGRLVARWERWEHGSPGPAAGLAMVAALLEASPTDDRRRAVERGLGLVAHNQRADGSWPGADTFQVLETLLDATRRGYSSTALDETLVRGANLLATTQTADDGMWGRATSPRRLRIGLRALRAVRTTGARRGPIRSS